MHSVGGVSPLSADEIFRPLREKGVGGTPLAFCEWVFDSLPFYDGVLELIYSEGSEPDLDHSHCQGELLLRQLY